MQIFFDSIQYSFLNAGHFFFLEQQNVYLRIDTLIQHIHYSMSDVL